MNFDWSEYLKLAKELTGNPKDPSNSEAKERSAISRAYYACHSVGRSFINNRLKLSQKSELPKTGEAHGLVIKHFNGISDKDYFHKKISSKLSRLLDNRRHADYDDEITNLPKLVEYSLLLSDEIMTTIKKIRRI